VDGDTIVLNGEKIRFTGIDTPELKQTCLKNDQKVDCGMTAKMLLVKKIGDNTPECISEGKDAYKRTLAECFVNGESLSKFLVRSGYAFAYRKYSTKFVKDEEFAKANKHVPIKINGKELSAKVVTVSPFLMYILFRPFVC
jgi:endonuclease YncB( thermonuclease family)